MRKKQEIKITISGSQGSGKTVLGGVINNFLTQVFCAEILNKDDVRGNKYGHDFVSRLLKNKKIIIETTNE